MLSRRQRQRDNMQEHERHDRQNYAGAKRQTGAELQKVVESATAAAHVTGSIADVDLILRRSQRLTPRPGSLSSEPELEGAAVLEEIQVRRSCRQAPDRGPEPATLQNQPISRRRVNQHRPYKRRQRLSWHRHRWRPWPSNVPTR